MLANLQANGRRWHRAFHRCLNYVKKRDSCAVAAASSSSVDSSIKDTACTVPRHDLHNMLQWLSVLDKVQVTETCARVLSPRCGGPRDDLGWSAQARYCTICRACLFPLLRSRQLTAVLMSASRSPGLAFLYNTAVLLAYLRLQVVAQPNPASQTPLPLPANPATDCGLAVIRRWSKDYPQCMQSILGNSLIYNEPFVDPGV